MNKVNNIRMLASAAVIMRDIYCATYFPGPMDAINGMVAGIVLYAIWRNMDGK